MAYLTLTFFLPKISEKFTEKIPTFGEGGQAGCFASFPYSELSTEQHIIARHSFSFNQEKNKLHRPLARHQIRRLVLHDFSRLFMHFLFKLHFRAVAGEWMGKLWSTDVASIAHVHYLLRWTTFSWNFQDSCTTANWMSLALRIGPKNVAVALQNAKCIVPSSSSSPKADDFVEGCKLLEKAGGSHCGGNFLTLWVAAEHIQVIWAKIHNTYVQKLAIDWGICIHTHCKLLYTYDSIK